MTPGVQGISPARLLTQENSLALQFQRLSPAPVTYVVQSSTNLLTWTSIATLPAGSDAWTGPATVTDPPSGSPRTDIIMDTAPIGNGARFLRLDVTAP
jgi:hypothetical protein